MTQSSESSGTILKVDPYRFNNLAHLPVQTGIFTRAELNGKFISVDIVCLTRESLIEWLQSDSKLAIGAVMHILGYPGNVAGL